MINYAINSPDSILLFKRCISHPPSILCIRTSNGNTFINSLGRDSDDKLRKETQNVMVNEMVTTLQTQNCYSDNMNIKPVSRLYLYANLIVFNV